MITAMVLYALATLWDATLTIIGLHWTSGTEVGWVCGPMVVLLGPIWGVLATKLPTVVYIIGCYYIHRTYVQRGRQSYVPQILIIGAILTTIGGAGWLIQ